MVISSKINLKPNLNMSQNFMVFQWQQMEIITFPIRFCFNLFVSLIASVKWQHIFKPIIPIRVPKNFNSFRNKYVNMISIECTSLGSNSCHIVFEIRKNVTTYWFDIYIWDIVLSKISWFELLFLTLILNHTLHLKHTVRP